MKILTILLTLINVIAFMHRIEAVPSNNIANVQVARHDVEANNDFMFSRDDEPTCYCRCGIKSLLSVKNCLIVCDVEC